MERGGGWALVGHRPTTAGQLRRGWAEPAAQRPARRHSGPDGTPPAAGKALHKHDLSYRPPGSAARSTGRTPGPWQPAAPTRSAGASTSIATTTRRTVRG